MSIRHLDIPGLYIEYRHDYTWLELEQVSDACWKEGSLRFYLFGGQKNTIFAHPRQAWTFSGFWTMGSCGTRGKKYVYTIYTPLKQSMAHSSELAEGSNCLPHPDEHISFAKETVVASSCHPGYIMAFGGHIEVQASSKTCTASRERWKARVRTNQVVAGCPMVSPLVSPMVSPSLSCWPCHCQCSFFPSANSNRKWNLIYSIGGKFPKKKSVHCPLQSVGP